jgi:hypothetical protein
LKPETLAAALTQWRTAFLTDTMPAAVIVDNHVLTLETTLLLAAENLGRYPSAWQPIETAPKSTHAGGNTRIEAFYFLAYCPEPDAVGLESCVCVCWWEPLMNKGAGQWYGEGMYPLHPTHWMPLPKPPAVRDACAKD